MFTVNVRGQPFDAEKVARTKYVGDGGVPSIVAWGDMWNSSTEAWHALSKEMQAHYKLEGHKLAMIALAEAFCQATRNASSYKSNSDTLQINYDRLQITANDNLNKLKTAETELIAAKALCLQSQAEIQQHAHVHQELEQVKQALKKSEESVALKIIENQKNEFECKKLQSDNIELKNRIAKLETDHAAEIKKLNEDHKAYFITEIASFKAMLIASFAAGNFASDNATEESD